MVIKTRLYRWFAYLKPLFLILSIGLILIFLRACLFRPGTSYPGSHFNQGQNAIWLGVEWVNEPQKPEAIKQLAEDLKRYHIRYVFVYASYLKDTGEFNPTYDYANAFVVALKATYPEVVILAWVGLPLNTAEWGYVDLRDEATRQKVASFGQMVVEKGNFDGLHLDPEPIAGE